MPAVNPGRVIVGGVRDVPGRTMFEKMQHLAAHQDGLRQRMLREPRGYPAANCNLVLPPTDPRRRRRLRDHGAGRIPADVGHQHHLRDHGAARDGHGADARTGHRADARGAGRAHTRPRRLPRRQGHAGDVHATCRPSPSISTPTIDVPTLGRVRVDVAWGGMFYVIADAAPFGLALTPDEGRDITESVN